jgi:hypothetical protein
MQSDDFDFALGIRISFGSAASVAAPPKPHLGRAAGGAGSRGAPGARNGHTTALFTYECQSFLTGPAKRLPPQFRRTTIDYLSKEPAGTIIIDTPHTYLSWCSATARPYATASA